MASPSPATRFQQVETSDDICVNEIARPGYGAINMRFCRQMQHVRDGMTTENLEHRSLVAKVRFLENIFRMAGDSFQVFLMAGIGEAIEVDELLNFGSVDDVLNQIRPDKSCAAGDEQIHGWSFSNRSPTVESRLFGIS